MANGDTLREIKEMVSQRGAIKMQSAMRLSLDLQAQTYEAMSNLSGRVIALEDEMRKKANSEELKRVEQASIVLWMQSHPKLTTAIIVSYLFISAFLDVRQVLAFALGIKLP